MTCVTSANAGADRAAHPSPAPSRTTGAGGPRTAPGRRRRRRRPAADRSGFHAARLGPATRRRVTGSSWHAGCPVALADLRYVRVRYWAFDGRRRIGELVVHRDAVGALRRVFSALYERRFPIRRMRLVDDFGADDFSSIQADNTTAFNCRRATGSVQWSQHTYGRAVDINPIENPYVYADGTTSHAASRPYLDRSARTRGVARPGGVLVAAFDSVGWGWGGRWPGPRDYQHFSRNGR